MYNETSPQQVRGVVSAAPQIVKPLAPGAFSAQAGMNDSIAQGLQPLTQALMKAKLNNKLQGKLPGTTPQSIGTGSAGSDMATGPQSAPLSLGGSPSMMNA
jgi:hypothetical protein